MTVDWAVELVDELSGLGEADAPQLLEDLFQHRAEVHQATGMASVQLDVGMADALVAIRAHAYASDHTVAVVAASIVARTLRLEP